MVCAISAPGLLAIAIGRLPLSTNARPEDAMTADWTWVPYEVLECISTRITNEVAEVNRVVLDITNKPPGTIEWE